VVRYVLPPGSGGRGGGGRRVWGLSRHEWGDIHFYLAVAAVLLLVVHLALHWAWVCRMVRAMVGGSGESADGGPGGQARLFYGAAAVAVCALVLSGFLWLAIRHVKEEDGSRGGRGRRAWDADRGSPCTWIAASHGVTLTDRVAYRVLPASSLTRRAIRCSPAVSGSVVNATASRGESKMSSAAISGSHFSSLSTV